MEAIDLYTPYTRRKVSHTKNALELTLAYSWVFGSVLRGPEVLVMVTGTAAPETLEDG
jgi:hypothetical protein